MAITLDGTTGITSPAETVAGAVTAASVAATGAVSGTTGTFTGAVNSTNTFGFKNRIINGNMAIDQRNAGASVVGSTHSVDRFYFEDGATVGVFSSQQVSDAPTGFIKSLKVTATTGTGVIGGAEWAVITQQIEGYNVADLAFGTASASSVTASFWVKATTIGTYSCTIYNSATTQINPQPFTINVANTWEQKTIPFTGSTSGVWLTDNGRGISFNIYMTLGTNHQSTAGWNDTGKYGVTGSTNAFVTTGNTFQITGVQLEKSSTATSFDYRPYGTELSLCQRYYWQWYVGVNSAQNWSNMGQVSGNQYAVLKIATPVPLRAAPSISISPAYNSGWQINITSLTNYAITSTPTVINWNGDTNLAVYFSATGIASIYYGLTWILYAPTGSNSNYMYFSSEL